MEIIVGLDNDDPTLGEAIAALTDFPVKVVTCPRKPTTAQLFNYLGKQATGDWLIPFPDDYVVEQEDWAEKLQPTLDMLPGRLGVAYLWDPMYPHFATFPVLSRKMIDMAGFFLPPFFPFLHGDTWWNEVGVMSGMILPAKPSVKIQQDTGHIHRYRDLRLWSGVFTRTRPMRIDMAIQMLKQAYGEESDEANYLISTIPERSAMCIALQGPQLTDEFFAKWEAWGETFENPHYSDLKQKAEKFMELTACS